MVDLSLDKIKYGGLYHYFFWDKEFNPLATVSDCLADCTCFVLGDCGVTGTPRPVSKAVNAGNWHNYLANGWTYINYDISKVKVGDILEWTNNIHVCRVFKIVDGVPWIRASFYTGEHGVSKKDGSFDTRTSFQTLEQVSDFMVKNYPERMYHEFPLSKEIKYLGGEQPAYILVMPRTVAPVERNESVNQIQTTDTTLRIRTAPSLSASIVGHVSIGYYNVLNVEKATAADTKAYKEQKNDDLNCWYEIAKDRWCGNPSTAYLPKKDETDISAALKTITETVTSLQNENTKLKEGVKQIADIATKLL